MDDDKTRLLFGPYTPPPLKVGDRAFCHYRDKEDVVYDWTVAPISWPLCYVFGTRGAGKGLLVEEELGRAIRHESATALQYWWGVSKMPVWKWRRALGVGRKDTEGSQRLIHQASQGGLNARRRYAPVEIRLWMPEELALVGQLPDAEVARRTGRTDGAVRMMRQHLGLPAVRIRNGYGYGRRFEEVEPEPIIHRTCPACGSGNYAFRGCRRIAADSSKGREAAREMKYLCKACSHEWKVRMATPEG